MNLMTIFYVLTTMAALGGFLITIRIYREKHAKRPMVCPLGAHCDTVVHSEFSTFLGIGLELYGAAYYGLIAVSYAALSAITLFMPAVEIPHLTSFVLSGLSIGAFLFSLYLTFVQAFYLRSWCTWCLFSAAASTLIFTFSSIALALSDFALTPILIAFQQPILILQVAGFVLGLLGATLADILLIKFLQDFHISPGEDKTLKLLSQITWVGIFFLIIASLGLYIPAAAALSQSVAWITQMIIITIIVINGALLNLVVSPHLVKISCAQCLNVHHANLLRRSAFALGAVSFFSWYSAVFIHVQGAGTLSLTETLSLYGLITLFGVLVSQIIEGLFVSRFARSTKQ